MKKQEIERSLRNYHWMVKEIARLRSLLEDAGESIVKPMDENSDMPKPTEEVAKQAFQDVRFLLSELERLEREYAEERAAHNAHVTELCELEQERDKLIEGLRWYAESKNYRREFRSRHGTLVEPAEAIYYDGGQRAREILKEIGVTVE